MTTQNFQASQEYLLLKAYVERRGIGDLIEYSNVEGATGVVMDALGKAKLRRAIESCGHAHTCIASIGYKLAAPDDAPFITGRGLLRMDGVRRRETRHIRNMRNAFGEELDVGARQQMDLAASAYQAIGQVVQNNLKLYGKHKNATVDIGQVVIEVPNVQPFK